MFKSLDAFFQEITAFEVFLVYASLLFFSLAVFSFFG